MTKHNEPPGSATGLHFCNRSIYTFSCGRWK